MAAKKVEVFQSEYEYLTQFHKEATLELASLRAEREKLHKDYDDLMKAFAAVCYAHDCANCKQTGNLELVEFCRQADCECDKCSAPCPCRECDHGSNFEWDKGGSSDGD